MVGPWLDKWAERRGASTSVSDAFHHLMRMKKYEEDALKMGELRRQEKCYGRLASLCSDIAQTFPTVEPPLAADVVLAVDEIESCDRFRHIAAVVIDAATLYDGATRARLEALMPIGSRDQALVMMDSLFASERSAQGVPGGGRRVSRPSIPSSGASRVLVAGAILGSLPTIVDGAESWPLALPVIATLPVFPLVTYAAYALMARMVWDVAAVTSDEATETIKTIGMEAREVAGSFGDEVRSWLAGREQYREEQPARAQLDDRRRHPSIHRRVVLV